MKSHKDDRRMIVPNTLSLPMLPLFISCIIGLIAALSILLKSSTNIISNKDLLDQSYVQPDIRRSLNEQKWVPDAVESTDADSSPGASGRSKRRMGGRGSRKGDGDRHGVGGRTGRGGRAGRSGRGGRDSKEDMTMSQVIESTAVERVEGNKNELLKYCSCRHSLTFSIIFSATRRIKFRKTIFTTNYANRNHISRLEKRCFCG